MYIVLRNGNRSIRRNFETYDEARKAVRKLIRNQFTPWVRRDMQWFGDATSPNIGAFGYSIKRV